MFAINVYVNLSEMNMTFSGNLLETMEMGG